MSAKRTSPRFRPAVIATAVTLIYALWVTFTAGHPLALVTLGERYAPADLSDHLYSEEGYDGQFVYYLAWAGWEAAPYIDNPAYRAQRILLPVTGRVVSLGQESLLVWGLLLVNLIAVGVGTGLLENLLVAGRISRWYAIGYGLSLGVMGAARLTTTEPLAYGLVIVGIWLVLKERWYPAAVVFALAALSKETTLIFPAALGLWLLYQRKIFKAVSFGAVVLLPFIIWQGILYWQLGELGVGSGGALATGFEVIPFMGFLRILLEGGLAPFLLLLVLVGPFVLIPTLWGLWQSWRDYQAKRWSIYTLFLFSNAALMLFVPFSTYREPLGILRFIVGLQIAVILYAAQRRQQRVLRYSTLWLVTSLIVLSSDMALL